MKPISPPVAAASSRSWPASCAPSARPTWIRARWRLFLRRPGAAVPGQSLAAHGDPRAAADPRSEGDLAGRAVRGRALAGLVALPDAGTHAGRGLQRPRFAHHAFQICGPAGQGRHLRSVHRKLRPTAERGRGRADGRPQSAHLPRSGRAESRKLRRIAAQARLSSDPDEGSAQRGAGGRPGAADRLAARYARSPIRCAARARCRSRRRGSPCGVRRA